MAERLKEIKKQTAIAKLNDVPTSPRKMRLVADIIRGVEVNRALDILKFSKKHASIDLRSFSAAQSLTGRLRIRIIQKSWTTVTLSLRPSWLTRDAHSRESAHAHRAAPDVSASVLTLSLIHISEPTRPY